MPCFLWKPNHRATKKLKEDTYQAQARNKVITEAFYLASDIEKYGSGYTCGYQVKN